MTFTSWNKQQNLVYLTEMGTDNNKNIIENNTKKKATTKMITIKIASTTTKRNATAITKMITTTS